MRRSALHRSIAALFTVLAFACAKPAHATPPLDMAKRTEALMCLRWGVFLCWSFRTFSGREWTPGIEDVSFFKATGCWDRIRSTAKRVKPDGIICLSCNPIHDPEPSPRRLCPRRALRANA